MDVNMWLITSLGFIGALLYYVLKNSSNYWEKRGVPTASGCKWLFGHYKEVFFLKKHIAHFYCDLYNEFPEAPVVGCYIMSSPSLVVRDPDVIRTILTTEFANFSSTGYSVDRKYDKVGGYNPFFSKDEEWKMSRGHATPALSLAKLKGYLPTMFKVGAEMVKYVRKNCNESVVDMDLKDISAMFTTDVAANAICGIDSNTFEDRQSLFASVTEEVARLLNTGLWDNVKVSAVAAVPALNTIFQIRYTTKKLENLLVSLTRNIIRDRSNSGEKRNDFYQVMMDYRERDDKGDEYIAGHLFTIILDLFETANNCIMVTLFALAWHPEHQEKLRSEIRLLQSETNGEYTIEDVERLKYLDMVLCESMRLYSLVPVLSRECTNDCLLSIPGQKPLKLTKGTPVTVSITGIHMDPKYYSEPEKFDPERFSEEEIAKRPKFTFMPFGEGPRKCLGMRIGTLEVKVAIISIIQHFKLKPCARTSYPLDVDPRTIIVSRPSNGAWVYFEEIS